MMRAFRLAGALAALLLVCLMAAAGAEGARELPLISITVADPTHGSDFVIQPVDGYVSSQIALWTFGYVTPPEPWYEACQVTRTERDGQVSVSAPAQVKVRGNWTTSYPKKPLRIKFDKRQEMGIHPGAKCKSWVLLAGYKDMSLMRDLAGLTLSAGILGPDGYYAADCELVEVEINGQYWGVYLLTEQQQADKYRIPVNEPGKEETGVETGYLLEMDGYYFLEEPLQRFEIGYNGNAPLRPYDGEGGGGRTIACLSDRTGYRKKVGFSIKSEIVSEAQRDFIAGWVENVYRVLYRAAYDGEAWVFNGDRTDLVRADITPEAAVRAVVDVDSLADMYLISELTCDADIYWSSFFMYVDFGEGGSGRLTFAAPWDFDSGLGNKARCPDGKGFYAANIVPDVNGNEYETVNPWLAVLMYEPWYTDLIREKWTRAWDSGLFERTLEMLARETAEAQPAIKRNFARWDYRANKMTVKNELSEGAAACRTQRESAQFLCDWLAARVAFLDSHWHLPAR